MIMPVHGHPVHEGGPKVFQRYDEYIAVLDQAGIDRIVLWGNEYYGVDNSMIIAFLKKYPKRIVAAPEVSPFDRNVLDKMKMYVEEYGISGLKLHPSIGFYPNDKNLVYPIYEKAVDLRMKAVAFHCAVCGTERKKAGNVYCQPIHLDEPSSDFPELAFQISHCGWPLIEQTLMLQEKKNIYLDISWVRVFKDFWQEKVAMVLAAFGPGRLLFGNWEGLVNITNENGSCGCDVAKSAENFSRRTQATVSLLDHLGLDESAKGKVMGQNAAGIY